MSDQYQDLPNEDFEKVDADPNQDENVTSTSITGGEMAEEDRYADGIDAQNDVNFLAGEMGSMSSEASEPTKPLISFDQSPEPTAPPFPTESLVPGAKADSGEGNWVKTVDPRDDPSVEEMAEHNEALPAELTEPVALSDPKTNPFSRDLVNIEPNKQSDINKEGNISDTDSVLSDSSECSSSGEESDSEASDSDSSNGPNVYNLNTEHDAEENLNAINKEIGLTNFENKTCSTKEEIVLEHSDKVGGVTMESQHFDQCMTPSDNVLNYDMAVEQNIDAMENIGDTNEPHLNVNKRNELSGCSEKQNDDGVQTEEFPNAGNAVKIEELPSELDALEQQHDNGRNDNMLQTDVPSKEENKLNEPPERNAFDHNSETLVTCDEENTHGLATVTDAQVIGSVPCGISETDLSDVLDRLINESDIVDNVSPVVSDIENDPDMKEVDNKRESSGSPDALSDGSESESCSSVDSDISGDEGVSGTWNPSPLYSFNGEDDEDEDETSDVYVINERQDENDSVNEAESVCIAEDNKLNELREDVKGLMEEMESLVKGGQNTERRPSIELDGTSIEVVGTADTIQSSFKQSDKSRSKLNSNNDEQNMLHVHFRSPTNTLLYDPESPIIEKVSAEMQNELIDYDDEAKDKETEKEKIGETNQAELQAEVVKDLKELYDEIESNREVGEDKIGSKKDLEAKVSGDSLNKLETIADPLSFSLYKRKNVDEAGEEEVVLRKKNNRNSDTVSHRSMQLTDDESNRCDSMIIHDLELSTPFMDIQTPPTIEEVVTIDSASSAYLGKTPDVFEREDEVENDDNAEMKSSTDSMIIYDDEEIRLNEISESFNRSTVPRDNTGVPYNSIVEESIKNVNVSTTEANIQITKGTNMKEDVEQESDRELAERLTTEINRHYDLNPHICNSDDDVNDSNSAFDVSLNETVIEAHTEVPDEEDDVKISNKSNLEGVENDTVSGGDVISHSEIVETVKANKEVVSDNKKGITDRNGKTSAQIVTMEMILHLLTQVLELIYWRDVKKTGSVFGSMMIILLSLSLFSLMSVLSYLSIGILCVTISFRLYKHVMQAVQKTNEGHPFKSLLQMNIELHEDVVKNAADKIAQNINNCAGELRRLYLVEDYVDTLKFGLLLWLLTYVGGWFNGMTLVILAVVSIFTLPKVYETYKVPIDQNVNLVRTNLNNLMAQVSAKIPFPKKKAKTQ